MNCKMKLLIVSVLLVLFTSNTFINSQPIDDQRGDGFWTQVSSMRMEQILWINDTLYAARGVMYQSNGGVYRSTDGGVNWDTLYSTSDFISGGLRLFIHPNNHKILFLIYGSLYKSTNGGQSWNYVFGANGPLVRLAINPKNPDIMYVTKTIPFGTVYKTTNGGASWFTCGNGLINELYFQAGPIDINPEYPDTVLLGTNTGLYCTTNGGNSWDSTSVKGFIPGINFHPKLPNIAFASSTYDWTTYKTTNSGLTWYKTVGSDGEFNRRMVFDNAYLNIIYNTENLKSIDTGNTWFKLDSINNSWNDIDINNSLFPTLFATSGTYGLHIYNDFTSALDEVVHNNQIFALHAYPNPFNSSTNIQFSIPESQEITLKVFDILGREVKTLTQDKYFLPGSYKNYWNGTNEEGNSVSSGIYICQIISNINNSIKVTSLKLMLLK